MNILIAEGIRKKFVSLRSSMNERVTRHWAAAEATALGYGGIALVARATGVSLNRIRTGIAELAWQDPLTPAIPLSEGKNGEGKNGTGPILEGLHQIGPVRLSLNPPFR